MDKRLSSLGVTAVLGTSAITMALAAGAAPAVAQPPDVQTVQAPAQRSFNIGPQSLAGALPLFGQQSGRQISADAALVRGLSTPGVQGTMSVDEALQRLLAGTGLTYSLAGGTTIALQRMGQAPLDPSTMQLDPVQVQGVFPVPSQAMIDNIPPPYVGGQVATGGQLGLLGNRSVMETPFNQTSYTAQKAQDQQAQTIRDVLVDDPSVRIIRPTGNNGAQNMMIRGFTVEGTDIAYGGLYGLLPSYSIGVELAEL
jgi:iron complex outermembrane recepter protein